MLVEQFAEQSATTFGAATTVAAVGIAADIVAAAVTAMAAAATAMAAAATVVAAATAARIPGSTTATAVQQISQQWQMQWSVGVHALQSMHCLYPAPPLSHTNSRGPAAVDAGAKGGSLTAVVDHTEAALYMRQMWTSSVRRQATSALLGGSSALRTWTGRHGRSGWPLLRERQQQRNSANWRQQELHHLGSVDTDTTDFDMFAFGQNTERLVHISVKVELVAIDWREPLL